MMQKLYTNSGLILLAILAAGVWFSNVRDIFTARNAPHANAVAAPSPGLTFEQLLEQAGTPAPTPTPSVVKSYERKQTLIQAARRYIPDALCNDWTFDFNQNPRGPCSGHGGVARWFIQRTLPG
jgi:uncharacterized protein DUF3761